ncbi:MAG TPA: hypothetical protein DIV57_02095 [Stenotrophomonas sp.]|nr:hypothetical protein [Stenotrophomonas sp.]
MAEGVETPAQHELLLGLGCELFQGSLFGRPMPAEVLPEWMARHSSTKWQRSANNRLTTG